MIARYWNAGAPPSPELLAAYLDGELRGPVRKRVADWLAHHPEAAAEMMDGAMRGLAEGLDADSAYLTPGTGLSYADTTAGLGSRK